MSKRNIYIDFLRVIACIAVLCYHSGSAFAMTDIIIKILLNWCVPIFLMITGALFLNKKEVTMKSIITKTIPKILCIIFVWGFLYNIISIIIIGADGENIVAQLGKAVFMIFTADTTYCYQFWYLYLLVGMYLLVPFIKPWVEYNMEGDKPTAEVRLTIGIALLFSIIMPTVFKIIGYEGNFWKGAFASFRGFAFYLFCEAYLNKYFLSRKERTCIFITWLVQLLYIFVNVFCENQLNSARWFGYESLFTWEMAVLLFDAVHRIDFETWNNKLKEYIYKLAADSLGIYILHVMVLWVLGKLCATYEFLNFMRWLPIQVIIALLICISFLKVARKVPIIRCFV